MGEIKDRFDTAFRDHKTLGLPASESHEPLKREIRAIAPVIEGAIAAAALAGTDLDAAMNLVRPLLESAQNSQAFSEASFTALVTALAMIDESVGTQLAGAVADATSQAVAARYAAQTSAAQAKTAAEQALGTRPYYPTIAAGTAATTPPNTFLSDETGPLVIYDADGKPLGLWREDESGIRVSAGRLGAVCDGVADDAARITAGLDALVGRLGDKQAQTVVEIDFGSDTYTIKSTMIVQQNHVHFVGFPTFDVQNVAPAIKCSALDTGNNLFDVEIYGTVTGTVPGDFLLFQGGSQCKAIIRNSATVTGYLVRNQGGYSCEFAGFSHGELGVNPCAGILNEGVLSYNGQNANSINTRVYALGYRCTESAVRMEESQGFVIGGDIEQCQGPGVLLINCQNGEPTGLYTERNGEGATNGPLPDGLNGIDVPCDVRIVTKPGGLTTPNSSYNTIHANRFGGETSDVGGTPVVPSNIHLVGAIGTLIGTNNCGGRIRVEAGSDYTYIAQQSRLAGIDDLADYTRCEDAGQMYIRAGAGKRYFRDTRHALGLVFGSGDNSGHLVGIIGVSQGQTPARNGAFTATVAHADAFQNGVEWQATVTLPNAEIDANYAPQITLIRGDQGAATKQLWLVFMQPGSFRIGMDAPPGVGKAVQVLVTMRRTS